LIVSKLSKREPLDEDIYRRNNRIECITSRYRQRQRRALGTGGTEDTKQTECHKSHVNSACLICKHNARRFYRLRQRADTPSTCYPHALRLSFVMTTTSLSTILGVLKRVFRRISASSDDQNHQNGIPDFIKWNNKMSDSVITCITIRFIVFNALSLYFFATFLPKFYIGSWFTGWINCKFYIIHTYLSNICLPEVQISFTLFSFHLDINGRLYFSIMEIERFYYMPRVY